MMQHDRGTNSPQSQPHSISNSQTSHKTFTTDEAVTPPASDTSGGGGGGGGGMGDMEGPSTQEVTAMLKQRYANTMPAAVLSGHESQLHHLSAVAAVQDKIDLDGAGRRRKRTADGEVKALGTSLSPEKGHSRNTSAVSNASTTTSTIGELSAELRTRLSYAMVKVNNGWQSRSLDEVESLASQAVSPTSSNATAASHFRNGSFSTSPRLLGPGAPGSQVHSSAAQGWPVMARRESDSPPCSSSAVNALVLAPPAPIQPMSVVPRSRPRRNSNPRYAPTTLSHSLSTSSSTNAAPVARGRVQPPSLIDQSLLSPRKNVREQDAIETLLIMSSPGNSASLKHSLSPSGSPGPQHGAPLPRSVGDGHVTLPSSGPARRGLPSTRPANVPAKNPALHHSPRETGSPQQAYHTPHRGGPKNQPVTRYHRSALSLPSGLGLSNGTGRKVLDDKDIDRMLDRASAELADTSDEEEIPLPSNRNDFARVM